MSSTAKKLGLFLSLLMTWSEFVGAANHRLMLNEELRLSVPIASHSLNRLVVVGDRIQHLFGEDEAFSLQSDEQSGQVFIKPSLGNGNKPLVLTLITENGLTQDLDLVPGASEPSTIILKPKSHQASEVPVPLAQSPMQQGIETVRQAVLGRLPIQDTPKASHRSHKSFELKYQKTYSTKDLKVEVWHLKNKTKVLQEGFEEAFYQKGDLALSLEKKVLAPSEATTLYILGKHHV